MSTSSAAAFAAEGSVSFARIIAAPRPLVFRAWTDPAMLAQWWGPRCFTNPVCEGDVRPGGTMRIVMRGPDGSEHPMTATFHEVVAPERLVFATAAFDLAGDKLLEGMTTVAFADLDGRTRLDLHSRAVGIARIAAQMISGMEAGWGQSLDKLAELVSAPISTS